MLSSILENDRLCKNNIDFKQNNNSKSLRMNHLEIFNEHNKKHTATHKKTTRNILRNYLEDKLSDLNQDNSKKKKNRNFTKPRSR